MRSGQHDDREEQAGADQHRAATDPVGQHAQGERAHQHPEQARAEDWAEAGLVDAPRLDDGRRDVAHRLHIEAVDDDGQADTWKALTLLASITAEMSTA